MDANGRGAAAGRDMRKFIFFFVWAAALAAATAAATLEGRVTELTLDNGMRWYFVERHGSPTFAGVVQFRVGGVDEGPGESGLAHLFEHMAFKGTTTIGTRDYAAEAPLLARIEETADALAAERAKEAPDAARVDELAAALAALQEEEKKYIVKDEFWEVFGRAGAVNMNAWTSKDLTTYVNALPANRLELWCLMEADRVADPVFREFYVERDVVTEERRMRADTSPGGKLYEEFIAAAFTVHPYRSPILGWPDELVRLRAAQARDFHRRYYSPGNAVGVLVGDFKTRDAEKLVRKYFGRLAAGPPPAPVTAGEPPQLEERRVDVPFDAEPQLLIGYHIPTYPDPDYVPLTVLASLLSSGRSSRLYTRLVKERELATVANAYVGEPGQRYPNLFLVELSTRAPHTAAELEGAFYDELARLATEPPSAFELEKVKNQVDAKFEWDMSSNLGLALTVAYNVQLYGDWRYIDQYRAEIARVTAEDVVRVAARYLTPTNRTVATLLKPAEVK